LTPKADEIGSLSNMYLQDPRTFWNTIAELRGLKTQRAKMSIKIDGKMVTESKKNSQYVQWFFH
jgi:hypothetical protein